MNQFLIVALGNPGKQFEGTRHNLGQAAVSSWVNTISQEGAEVSPLKHQEKLHAALQVIQYRDTEITILIPNVFMNESGKAVAQYLRYHDIPRNHIVVVHDDLEVLLGDVRYQLNGSAHGHNGVRSIHEYIGDTNIPQLRIGIGRPQGTMPVDVFVLASFTPDEKKILQEKQNLFSHTLSDLIVQNQNPK